MIGVLGGSLKGSIRDDRGFGGSLKGSMKVSMGFRGGGGRV